MMRTVREVSWRTAKLGGGGTIPMLAAQAGEQLGKWRVGGSHLCHFTCHLCCHG